MSQLTGRVRSGLGRLGAALGRIDPAIVVFCLSIAALGYGFGVVSAKYEIFPYPVINQAGIAVKSLLALEDEKLMVGLIEADDALAARPTITVLDERAGTEPLLIVGGAYQYMEQCPRFGCLAWIMDRDGTVLHAWETDLESLFTDLEGFSGNISPQNFYPVGAALAPDGGLFLSFHGRNIFPYQVGVAKFALDGTLAWKRFDGSHHWIGLDSVGNLYAPSMVLNREEDHFRDSAVEVKCWSDTVFDEGVRVYNPGGQLLKEFKILDSFEGADFPGFFYSVKDGCDPVHINSVQVASAEVAARIPGIRAGDLLVSVREPSVIAILDHEDGRILHLVAGRTAAQHSPKFLPNGDVLVFDNQGGDRDVGGSRIARIDMVTGEVSTVFPRPDSTVLVPFYSGDGSHISISPDGKRLMTSVKDQGIIAEIEIETGTPLWTLQKTFDIAPYLDKAGVNASGRHGLFKPYGAHYVRDLSFLGKRYSKAPAGVTR